MATIRKVPRKNGHAWLAVINLRGIKPFSKTFRLKANAKAWAERMETNLEVARVHGNAVARTMDLGELIWEYMRTLNGKKTSNISNLTWWSEQYGHLKVVDVDRTTVKAGLATLKAGEGRHHNNKTKSTGRKRSNATLNRYKASLSSVFEYACEEYDLPENPCRQVKGLTENNSRVRFLSDDEFVGGETIKGERTLLLEACKEAEWDRLYLLVLMALTTGARQGELLRLRWGDVRLSERRAYVDHTKNGEPRVLPLVDSVVHELRKLPRPLDANTLIFASEREPSKPFEFRKHWNKSVKAASITNFRFHDLRHSCASFLAQNGATLLQIADILGHKQLEVTKRYAHLCVDHKQALVDQVMGGMK